MGKTLPYQILDSWCKNCLDNGDTRRGLKMCNYYYNYWSKGYSCIDYPAAQSLPYLCIPFKMFTCVFLMYRKCLGDDPPPPKEEEKSPCNSGTDPMVHNIVHLQYSTVLSYLSFILVFIIRNLEPNCQYSYSCSNSSEILAKIFASILHLGSQFWNKKIEYFSWHWKYQ